jgi:hypothetical protein
MNNARETQKAGISRRAFMAAAGAAGIVAATARALPAHAASASQFLGSNMDVFTQIQSAVPGLRGVRIYGEHPSLFDYTNPTIAPPATWASYNNLAPQWPGPPSGLTNAQAGPIVYSIYPIPATLTGLPTTGLPDELTIGQIQQIIATAPPNSYMTAWHEAFGLTYPGYITVPAMLEVHSALNQMCLGTNVTYGSIFGGGDPATLWASVPSDLGFYGFDVYANISIDDGMSKLETFIADAKDNTPDYPWYNYPPLLIPETNTPTVDDRPTWFNDVCGRMHQYGSNSIGVLTFWGGQCASLSGAWLPGDAKTIQAMKDITGGTF